jgi:PKHD-type hydroxylase
MLLEHNYWFFESVIPPKICDDIIKFALDKKETRGVIGGYENKKDKEGLFNLKQKRNCNIVWLNEPWIYEEIMPYANIANINSGWDFQIDYPETMQFTKYKKGQFYDWHCDALIKSEPKIRKLSMTCQLTDQSEYKGGELEFDFRTYNPVKRDESRHVVTEKRALSKGSIIVFPSFVWHRVKPVHKGTRYSLVVWCRGKKFK